MNEYTEEKVGIGARIGYFFLSWTPLLACLALQFGLAFIYMFYKMIEAGGIIFFFLLLNPGVKTAETVYIFEQAVYSAATGGVVLYHLASIPIFGLWYYFGCKRPKIRQSFKNLSVKAIVVAILGGFVMSILANAIVGLEQYLLPDLVKSYVEMMDSVGVGVDIWMIVATVLLAPIGEELLCRGIILFYANKAVPKFWIANILQALMFGIMHFNWVQGIYAFVIGLFLGYLKKRYKSILPCMLLHFMVNLLSTIGFGQIFAYLPETFLTYLITTCLMLVATAGLVALGKHKKSS